jgi:hypothetical protein
MVPHEIHFNAPKSAPCCILLHRRTHRQWIRIPSLAPFFCSSPNPLKTQQNQGFSSLGTPGCQTLRGRRRQNLCQICAKRHFGSLAGVSQPDISLDLPHARRFPRQLLLEGASVCRTLLDFSPQRRPAEPEQVEIRLARTITMC